MNIGLFFGTFNPIHVGHLIIANYMADFTDLDEVWLVVSPHNPLKQKDSLLNEYDRLHLVELAIEGNDQLRVSNIEFDLPKPSYTTHTLAYLNEKYPNKKFALIMGSDNLRTLHKWKNYEQIIENHKIYLYNRPQYDDGQFANHKNVRSFDVPLLNISSSFIRDAIKKDSSIQYLVADKVKDYIEKAGFYL